MRTALILAATITGTLAASAGAAIIYDDFTDPAEGPPNSGLWQFSGGNYYIGQSGGVLTMSATGNVELISTASFSYSSFIFEFTGTGSGSYFGFGLVAGSDRILLRTDMGSGLHLDVYTQGTHYLSPTAFEFGADDTWEFQYRPDQLALLRNGVSVFSQNLTLTSDPVQISLFAYSGATIRLDSVSTLPIPEPSMTLMTGGLMVLAAGVVYRRRKAA